MRVPDEFRRLAVMGTKGMAEGDFVRGILRAHEKQNNIILYAAYGTAVGEENKHDATYNRMVRVIKQN